MQYVNVLECRFNDACTLQQNTITQLLNDKVTNEKVSDSQYDLYCVEMYETWVSPWNKQKKYDAHI